jgi:hypothetical protein
MKRERALKVVLVVVALIFIAGIYPLITSVRDGWRANKEDPLPMGISLYVTQGIFLLLAARDPLANRGVITFAAWLNIAHAGVMTVMTILLPNERQDLLVASAVFGAIGAVLITLPPRTQPAERVATQENLPRDLPPTFLQKR